MIGMASSLKSIEHSGNQRTSSTRLPSISLDRISSHSHQESRCMNIKNSQENFLSNNNKSIDQNSVMNKTRSALKHFSTPSLGEISNQSDMIR
jgi:hypothetical protein